MKPLLPLQCESAILRLCLLLTLVLAYQLEENPASCRPHGFCINPARVESAQRDSAPRLTMGAQLSFAFSTDQLSLAMAFEISIFLDSAVEVAASTGRHGLKGRSVLQPFDSVLDAREHLQLSSRQLAPFTDLKGGGNFVSPTAMTSLAMTLK